MSVTVLIHRSTLVRCCAACCEVIECSLNFCCHSRGLSVDLSIDSTLVAATGPMSAAASRRASTKARSIAAVGLSGLTRWHQLFVQHNCHIPPHRCLASLHPRLAAPTPLAPAASDSHCHVPSASPSSVHFDVSAEAFPPRRLLRTLDALPAVSALSEPEATLLRYQTLPPLPLPAAPQQSQSAALQLPVPLHPAALHKPRVTVALSGGVDSSVSAFLLREAGYSVRCVYMANWDERDETGQCSSTADRADAEAVCRHLSLPVECVEFVREYWVEVFERMVAGYSSGLTPNPDVWCNRHIKFGRLLQWLRAKEEAAGADERGVLLATGHYARTQRVFGVMHEDGVWTGGRRPPYVRTDMRATVDDSLAYVESLQPTAGVTGLSSTFAHERQYQQPDRTGAHAHATDSLTSSTQQPQLSRIPLSPAMPLLSTRLLTALDPHKDQTYFLSLIPASALPHLLFPLGCLTKAATRALARHAGLPTASKPDSMGICMIGRRPFNSWLAEYIAVREGRFIDETGREVGPP